MSEFSGLCEWLVKNPEAFAAYFSHCSKRLFSKRFVSGKVTEEQIKAGYSLLKQIEEFITKKDFSGKFVVAVNSYYTKIPHCFGFVFSFSTFTWRDSLTIPVSYCLKTS